jgi:hypothetical protein
MTATPNQWARQDAGAHVPIALWPALLLLCGGCTTMVEAIAARELASTLPTAPVNVVAARINLSADEVATVSVNGQSAPVRMGPGRSSVLHLRANDAAIMFGPLASQFERRGDWPGAQRATERIGPVTVGGHRASSVLLFPFGNYVGPVEWFGREEAAMAAGQVGPFGIPATIVQFRLRAAQTGERTVTLPLDEEANGWGIASTSLMIDRQRVRFAFAPHFATSVASAAAGGAMARAQGGRFTGPPQQVAISHGVERPARPVRLDRASNIGPVVLAQVLVRTLDYGAPRGIADQADSAESPADILVTARTDRQAPQYIVYLGADALSHCSSVTFDKAAMTISLSCAFT